MPLGFVFDGVLIQQPLLMKKKKLFGSNALVMVAYLWPIQEVLGEYL